MIKLEDCKHRGIYEIHSRNLKYGVFNKETDGFVGIREKFGSEFLFEELHWDAHKTYGTVKPLVYIGMLPDGLEPVEGWWVHDGYDSHWTNNHALFKEFKENGTYGTP